MKILRGEFRDGMDHLNLDLVKLWTQDIFGGTGGERKMVSITKVLMEKYLFGENHLIENPHELYTPKGWILIDL